MAEYADRIATQFIQGTKTNKSSRLYAARFTPSTDHIGGVDTQDKNGPEALYSYGPHYPVAIKEQDPEYTTERYIYWVNETPYLVTEEEQIESGYRQVSPSAYYYRPMRKPPKTGSPTTNGHRRSVEDALRRSGYYQPTEQTRTIETERPDGNTMTHTLRKWSLDR